MDCKIMRASNGFVTEVEPDGYDVGLTIMRAPEPCRKRIHANWEELSAFLDNLYGNKGPTAEEYVGER